MNINLIPIDKEVQAVKTRNKTLWLVSLVLVFGVAVGVLGHYTWTLRQQVDQLQANSATPARTPLAQSQGAQAGAPATRDWDPWDANGQFAQMQKRMDEMMRQMMPNDPMFGQQGFGQLGLGLSAGSPEITMDEDSDQYKVVVKLPEGENMQLNTDLADNTLTISGKVESKAREDDPSAQLFGHAEAMSQFSQSITLGEPVDEAGMKVDRNGEDIVITIPKRVG